MAFGLAPTSYLQIVKEHHAEFKSAPLSLSKAIAVSILANHILEHVFAAYVATDDQRLDGNKELNRYRDHLQRLKPELALIRDLCDFAKHGPRLDRKSVRVEKAETKRTMVPEFTGLLLGITNHHEEEKIVLTLDDGTERFFDYLINDVMEFWDLQFKSKNL